MSIRKQLLNMLCIISDLKFGLKNKSTRIEQLGSKFDTVQSIQDICIAMKRNHDDTKDLICKSGN